MEKNKELELRKEIRAIARKEIRDLLEYNVESFLYNSKFKSALEKALRDSEWLVHYVDLLKSNKNKKVLIDSLVANNDFIQPLRRMLRGEIRRKLKHLADTI